MHRSRFSSLLIDTPFQSASRSVDFWSAALGVPARQVVDEPQFTDLDGAFPGLVVAVQAVDAAPRFHIDIETDDVLAEVARLGALGAVEVSHWQDSHTMRAPGGHLLCVIPMHSDPEVFAANATTWE